MSTLNWLDPEAVREYFADPLNRHVSFVSLISGAWEQFGLAVARERTAGELGVLSPYELEVLYKNHIHVARLIRDAQEGK